MRFSVAVAVLALIGPTAARAANAAAGVAAQTCQAGISAAERRFALPPKLLQTIGIVESGRPDPVSGRVTPWPWTINVAGTGLTFATKEAAIQTVQGLQREGVKSIDVGCLQINLLHHPDAFASLDEAFNPSANTQYGARFLTALYHETGNWPRAAAAYHSRTDDIAVPYETRVMAIWPLARKYPDATLQQRARGPGPVAAPDPGAALYTPELAARVQELHAEDARLMARFGPKLGPVGQASGSF